uniref:Reverse transcriptase zinc-binding domain-containing protein n=1 Tax=Fagus sylvatica TaxID=28930 RepID=A0A2N9EPE9_FAGSY
MAASDYFKHGCLWGDWCSHNVTGPYGVCFWKAISNGWDRFLQFVSYKVGDGSSIKFWTDRWCGETSLKVRSPDLYRIARHKDASVRDLMSYKSSTLQWDVCFVCRVQDWEVDTITVFMDLLYSVKIRRDEADALCWNPSSRDIIDQRWGRMEKPLTICFSTAQWRKNHGFSFLYVWGGLGDAENCYGVIVLLASVIQAGCWVDLVYDSPLHYVELVARKKCQMF